MRYHRTIEAQYGVQCLWPRARGRQQCPQREGRSAGVGTGRQSLVQSLRLYSFAVVVVVTHIQSLVDTDS